jgi:hypothetical protein
MDFKTYQSQRYALQISYPNGWTVQEHEEITEKNLIMVQFLAPDGEKSVSIFTTFSEKDIPFDSVMQLNIKGLRQANPDFKIYESKQTWFSKSNSISNLDTPAHLLVCSFNGLTHRYLISSGIGPIAIQNSQVNVHYVILYRAKPEAYQSDLSVAEEMIQSFKIISPNTSNK